MGSGGVIALVLGLVLGLGVGWILWRRNGLSAGERANVGARIEGLRRQLRIAEADRIEAIEAMNAAKDELRSERSLLDGVASQSGIPPRVFRRALARDYLHTADPYRANHLDIEVAAPDRPSAEPDGANTEQTEQTQRLMASLQDSLDQRAVLVQRLAAREQELSASRAEVARVAALRLEVAELRTRVADQAIESNRLEAELGQHDLIERLDRVIGELNDIRDRKRPPETGVV